MTSSVTSPPTVVVLTINFTRDAKNLYKSESFTSAVETDETFMVPFTSKPRIYDTGNGTKQPYICVTIYDDARLSPPHTLCFLPEQSETRTCSHACRHVLLNKDTEGLMAWKTTLIPSMVSSTEPGSTPFPNILWTIPQPIPMGLTLCGRKKVDGKKAPGSLHITKSDLGGLCFWMDYEIFRPSEWKIMPNLVEVKNTFYQLATRDPDTKDLPLWLMISVSSAALWSEATAESMLAKIRREFSIMNTTTSIDTTAITLDDSMVTFFITTKIKVHIVIKEMLVPGSMLFRPLEHMAFQQYQANNVSSCKKTN